MDLDAELAPLVADFSGVVSVSRGDVVEYERGYGLADRPHRIPVAPDTQFAIASGTKAFTAVTLASLIAEGIIRLDTTARVWLGDDLPLIAADVTVEHLLTHRSGIGDYVDEDLDEEPPLNVPVQDLDTTEHYLPALDGFATKFAAGARFAYCNSGFVVLALIAERATGVPFAHLVAQRVFEPAGMRDTAFLRSDELPGRAAIGYLDDGRTNIFTLPIVGSGDGGAYTTAADLRAFWAALLDDRLVKGEFVHLLRSPSSTDTGHRFGYGMGFWLAEGGLVLLDGADHGVSARSMIDPRSRLVVTVLANTGDGAAPLAGHIRGLLYP